MYKIAISLATAMILSAEETEFSNLVYRPTLFQPLEFSQLPKRSMPIEFPIDGKILIEPDKDDQQKDKLVGKFGLGPTGGPISYSGTVGVDKQGNRSVGIEFSWDWSK
ncbi:MAG: hypothetical protein JSS32_00680 [Verrucomicrobia bacterium]|nr:hypothetical protein [Verrucomicrobiota bacterium]